VKRKRGELEEGDGEQEILQEAEKRKKNKKKE